MTDTPSETNITWDNRTIIERPGIIWHVVWGEKFIRPNLTGTLVTVPLTRRQRLRRAITRPYWRLEYWLQDRELDVRIWLRDRLRRLADHIGYC